MGAHTGPTKSWTTAHRGSLIHRSRFSGTHTGPTKSRTLVIVLLALLMTSVRGAKCDVGVCGISASSLEKWKRNLCHQHEFKYRVWLKTLTPKSLRGKHYRKLPLTYYETFKKFQKEKDEEEKREE